MLSNQVDTEQFRFRRFVELLRAHGELQIEEAPVAFEQLTEVMEASDKAVLFRHAGPEGFEMAGGVMGSRARMALALGGCDPRELAQALRKRLATPQDVVEIPSAQAPVHQVIWRGEEADLRRLPFYLQHQEDGGVYISAALDYALDPETGRPNHGSRRLFLRSHQTLSTNLSQPSDLKRMYASACARGENLPVSFVIGSHPLDFISAGLRIPGDEVALLAKVRGATLPMVRGVTNNIPVPADAELVIEGYFDTLGHRLPEGPYGEFWGLNGEMHINPVFHVTAITMRRDVLHQTVVHGSRRVSDMEAAAMASATAELITLNILAGAGIVPTAVYASPYVAVNQHVRVALRRGVPGQARQVIDLLHKGPGFRLVQVVDEEVDVFDDEDVEWAMSTRFRADRDVVIMGDWPGFHADPTRDEAGKTAKIGFDCTKPYEQSDAIEFRRPMVPHVVRTNTAPDVATALQAGPQFFAELLCKLDGQDARDVAMQLDTMLQAGQAKRVEDGKWALA